MKKYLRGLFVMLSVLFLLMSTAFASSDYTITDIRLTDLKGNAIEYDGGSCMVNVTVTKNTNVADGYVVISTYTEDETLIGFNYLFTSLEEGKSATLGALVSPPADTKIGKVKAMVWDSLDGMTPLAASKTLVPGEEIEEEPIPTRVVQIDGTLINEVAEADTNYNGVIINTVTENNITWYKTTLNIKKSSTTSYRNVDEYEFKDAKLYVNDFFYDDLDNSANIYDVRELIANSTGDTVLIDNNNDGYYDIVKIDVYAITQVVQVKASEDETIVRFIPLIQPSGAGAPGTILEVTADDLEQGDKVVSVVKDGANTTLDALASNDVVAIKYNLGTEGTATGYGKYVDIIASTKTASGVYTSYDPDTDLYTVGGVQYEDIGGAFAISTVGNTYTLYLDPFGRIYNAQEVEVPKNYAIVERYVKTDELGGSEYDYIDIVTLDGQQKRLFIDPVLNADYVLRTGTNDITYSCTVNAGVSMANRFISYKVKASTGRVKSIERETAVEFRDSFYNASTNRLDKTLSPDAVVLDAVEYTRAVNDTSKLDSSLYRASALSALDENVEYTGYLLDKDDASNQYSYVVITKAGALYGPSADFAVAAVNASAASMAYIDDEEVYALRVAGSEEQLLIDLYAEIYVNGVLVTDGDYSTSSYEDGVAYLKKGSAFFYTVNQYGYVDRIDVIFTNGSTQSAMQTILKMPIAANAADPRVKLAAAMVDDEVITADWYNKMDESGLEATRELVQIFVAPVISTSQSSVSFAELKSATAADGYDSEGKSLEGKMYIDTEKDYSFAIAADANIYSVNAVDLRASDAVGEGLFCGIWMQYADANGRAWLADDVANEYDFTDDVQYALVMAVDGVVTNAVVFDWVE